MDLSKSKCEYLDLFDGCQNYTAATTSESVVGLSSGWLIKAVYSFPDCRSAIESEITPKRFRRALLLADTDAILVPREATSMSLYGRRTVAAAGHQAPELRRITVHGSATHGIYHSAEAEAMILTHCIEKGAIGH
jgi:hypothetical protein